MTKCAYYVGFSLHSDCVSKGIFSLQDKPQQKAEKLDAGPELVRAPPAKLEAGHCGFLV